ncbi:Bacteroides conjugative transposon TraN protein [Arachidicoccus rhizosphaerae]|uniref:Bacteroides conjugative transposon TraN protein n=1 Tax=Arachidicoccus rhizosphaerae TaxID=551991 RepID=A0A1H3YU78_9BACT|nr:conjugative transposon protein TraN [Arachidicoccus rhizosphaerae]SEA15115.1 Bacteroides conjugative transposon TraN protein [Arachidicoccus rhizosphaerae]
MIKYIRVLFMLLIAVIPFGVFAQSGHIASDGKDAVAIASRNLSISCNKTSMLVFPAEIQSADRGAAYVLAERVKGSKNVLKVKAGRPDFDPSSLTVITADGQVYVFNVTYTASPACLVLDFRNDLSGEAPVRFKEQALNSAEMVSSAAAAKGRAPFFKRVHREKYGLDFKLEGIYIQKEVLFFKFRLHNASSIPYIRSSLNFFIRDLKTTKRTAMQDNELKPLYTQSWGMPEDDTGQMIVVALPRFTIADNKKLTLELMERDGDRAISLDLKERKFRKTKELYHQ